MSEVFLILVVGLAVVGFSPVIFSLIVLSSETKKKPWIK